MKTKNFILFIFILRANYCFAVTEQPRLLINNVYEVIAKADFAASDFPDLNIRSVNQSRDYKPATGLTSIKDLENCEYVSVVKASLKQVPFLNNLPKLSQVNFEQNDIELVSRTALSTVPAVRVRLGHNKIAQIEDGSFGDSLQTLDLSCNKLQNVSAAWFQNPENVQVLKLSGNLLTALEDRLFHRFTNLSALMLSHNQISRIGQRVFNLLPDGVLALQYNRLEQLENVSFAASDVYLSALMLHFNRFNFLETTFLQGLKVKLLTVHGNPWQCPCIRNIEQWMLRGRILSSIPGVIEIDSDLPVCVDALSFSEHCIHHSNPELYNYYSNALSSPTQAQICTNATSLFL